MDPTLVDKVPPTSLPTILNFRDVGQTVNILHDSPLLCEGLIYRSARPDEASPSDRAALTSRYGIKSIIDLRSTTEHIDQAKKHKTKSQIAASPIVPSEERASDVIKIAGVKYHEINLNGGAFARALLWRLRWSSLAKLISLMALGYRNAAIGILGREVMAPRGLIGLGKDTLDYGTNELRQIFFLLADPATYPILIHCTQGKDRTGLVIMLLLLLLDVPVDAISADYMASERELGSEKEARMKEIQSVGLGEAFAGCPEGFVNEMLRHINQNHLKLDTYLRTIGADSEVQESIRHQLLDDNVDGTNEISARYA